MTAIQIEPTLSVLEPGYVRVCHLDSLEPERGVAALVGAVQIALFRLHDDTVVAVDHHDPVSGANVIARGIVGSRGTTATVASPMYKTVYDLHTGACLDDERIRIRVHNVLVGPDGAVHVAVAP